MNQFSNSLAARDIAHQVHPQTNLRRHAEVGPQIMDGAEGCYVTDTSGVRYLDAMAGLWCVSLGYSDDSVKQAIAKQVEDLPYFQLFAHRSNTPSIELAEMLIERAPVPMSKVIFQCSGSEGNDTAVKLAWYYWNAKGKPEKTKILSRNRAYHGTGIASGSLTGLPNIHREFNLPLPGFLHTRCPHHYREAHAGESEAEFSQRLAKELEDMILDEGPDTVAAFFAEPIMGTGGVVTPPEGYFEAIQKVLKKYDVLLVADEVICGFGRTGEYWGSTAVGMQPDILVCAKSLSSAYLPISAVMVNESLWSAMLDQSDKVGVFGHGYTYGGHPVCSAAAIATLKRYDEIGATENAREVGGYLQSKLAGLSDHPLVGEVRGMGLMAGVEMVQDKSTKQAFDPALMVGAVCSKAVEDRGVLSRNLGDTMSLSPPLILTKADVDTIVDAMEGGLNDTLKWAQAEGHK